MEGQLEDELGRRRDANIVCAAGRHALNVLLNCLQNCVRVQFDVTHDLREQVPFDLSKGEKEMLDAKGGMLTTSRFVNGAVDNPLRGLADLARGDVEIVYLHVLPPACP